MSLTVPSDLLEQAKTGKVSADAFLECIRTSLPFAWEMVSRLVTEMHATGAESAQNLRTPPDEESWGQMFRMMASDSMRNAIQDHFGVRLGFQNCCKPGVFRPDAKEAYERFISPEAQLLNQNPSLLTC